MEKDSDRQEVEVNQAEAQEEISEKVSAPPKPERLAVSSHCASLS